MSDIGSTHSRILAALWNLEGKTWLEVQSEIHAGYNEIPFWFLLDQNMSAIEAHRNFWRVVEPELAHLGSYRLTASYQSIIDQQVLWHGFFDDLDGMIRALRPDEWNKPTVQKLSAARIFRRVRDR